MRRITYAGTWFDTGDEIVTASIDLAGKEIEDPGLVAMLRNKTAELR